MDIYFRAFELEDAEFINSLRNIENMENLIGGNKRYVSLARDRKWVENIILGDSQKTIYIAICEIGSVDIIGYTSISNIDHFNKSCNWGGIKLEPKFNRRGYGTQIAFLVIKYAFEELGMERVVGVCQEEHVVAKKMMAKVGYKVDGLQRHSLYKNGSYHNQYMMSILRKEYDEFKVNFIV
jgi:RimJ/RimL family protein N-acetyltransferase